MALFELTINLRLPPEISAALAALTDEVRTMNAEVQAVTQAVADVKASVAKIPPAIDAFEARITALIADSGMSQADKDELAAAVADLRGVVATVDAAAADAADGVDEAAPTP